MDRNLLCLAPLPWGKVALRKESVDRNKGSLHVNAHDAPSLSARRAWIEIAGWCAGLSSALVALRKESVDRNGSMQPMRTKRLGSLSARRAWIEINRISVAGRTSNRRTPQGERG